MRKNWLTTVGGIMAAFGTIPIALGTAHVRMPAWLYMVCISLAALGPAVIGVAAKGQDEPAELPKTDDAQTKAK
jgi:hypothetical protein